MNEHDLLMCDLQPCVQSEAKKYLMLDKKLKRNYDSTANTKLNGCTYL